jgi:hypothetical protein
MKTPAPRSKKRPEPAASRRAARGPRGMLRAATDELGLTTPKAVRRRARR